MIIKTDLTFNIHPVALAIANLIYINLDDEISDEDKFIVTVNTTAWYNGRERGICLSIYDIQFKGIFIVFGENRSSDNIFVDVCKYKGSINPPQWEDLTDAAYNKRKFFSYNQIYEATEYIQDIIKETALKIIKEYRTKGYKKNKKVKPSTLQDPPPIGESI